MVEQYLHFVDNISWLLLTLQIKVGKVASFVGKIFVSTLQPRKPRIFCPPEIIRYHNNTLPAA